MNKTKKVKLHLGCGKVFIPGFIHIDIADFEHIDYQEPINDLSFTFKPNSVDYIYCCHALEYFDRQEAEEALKEWYRVLKKGSLLRLAVPDFEAIIDIYRGYGDLEHRGILGPLYGRMKVNDGYIYHKTTYDFDSLKKLLEKVGFKDIKRFNRWETEHAEVDDFSAAYIPHMDFENGKLISLNVEAKK